MGQFEQLMEALGEEGVDLRLFATDAVKVLTQFKWEKYGNKLHGISTVIFLVYLITYFIYVNMKYNLHLYHNERYKFNPICYVMFACNTWAFLYDLR